MSSPVAEPRHASTRETLRATVDPVEVPADGVVGERAGVRADELSQAGIDPEPRLTFANERTYLAWNRTALALIVGGLAAAQFFKAGFAGAQLIVELPLIALGATLSYRSYRHWQRNQRAMRLAEPLPASALPRILGYGVATLALAATALAIIHFAS